MLRSSIETAGEFIRTGGLVVFPTETVYGLGADAFNAEAVRRVYSTKGRPGDNPLILHISSPDDFAQYAQNPPEYAFALIEAFWPGPLTLVARKKTDLPAWLGGHPDSQLSSLETIGIRMPAHPIALALIKAAGCPISAPSANKAGKPSPTTLAHVMEDFPGNEQNIMFLDGGSTVVGLESTVVDVTGEKPVILRPGAVTEEALFKISSRGFAAGCMDEPMGVQDVRHPRSPGMKYRHYAPRAEMTVLSGAAKSVADYILHEEQQGQGTNRRFGVLVREQTRKLFPQNASANMEILSLGADENAIAQNLFSRLREFDALGVDMIFAEAVPETGLGMAIMDRMKKAANGQVINL